MNTPPAPPAPEGWKAAADAWQQGWQAGFDAALWSFQPMQDPLPGMQPE